MCQIIKSRVLAGLIKVDSKVMPLYQRDWKVKPSGDTDVIEKQQMIQTMMQTWEIISQTPAAPLFLADLLEKLFPDTASRYIKVLQEAQAQQQSQAAQQQQVMMGQAMQYANGIIELSKHKEFFSEPGQLHAYPVIQQAAAQLEQLKQSMGAGAKQ
jgi:hypothetical protein